MRSGTSASIGPAADDKLLLWRHLGRETQSRGPVSSRTDRTGSMAQRSQMKLGAVSGKALSWQPLKTREDWTANRGGLLVVHQLYPVGGEAASKFHGRDCRYVQHRVFLDGPATGSDNSEWFWVPDRESARRGRAVACLHSGGV